MGWTPLHLAAANGHNLLAKLLTYRGADKEAKDQEGRTALHITAANGHSIVAGLLIDQDCDKEAKDREGQAGLHIAVPMDITPPPDYSLTGASKEAKDDLGWEALYTASWTGREPTRRALVQTFGANKEARDTSGWTARSLIDSPTCRSFLYVTPGATTPTRARNCDLRMLLYLRSRVPAFVAAQSQVAWQATAAVVSTNLREKRRE